jgi:hypothetical protein
VAIGALQTPLLLCGVVYTANSPIRSAHDLAVWLASPMLGTLQLLLCIRLIARNNSARVGLILLSTIAVCFGLFGMFDAIILHQVQSWWWSAPVEFTIDLVAYLLYPLLAIYILTRPATRDQFTQRNSTSTAAPVA